VDAFSEIFERLDRELWIVTARDGERRSGLVASYVARVSLVPALPRVTIALAKHHFTHELIEASGAFCMHLFGEDQIDWVWRFGIPSGRDVDKLSGLATTTGASGAPILAGALAWLDCRVEARMDTGDRTVFLGEVLDAGYGIQRTGHGDLRSGTVRGQASAVSSAETETRAQHWTPLTFKRLLELAPAERLQEMKHVVERDIELDGEAILEWRCRQEAREGEV
jgi:flavin reductase (DIM6/NTAB) family NADH-FMN oxidoreductase RutF